VKVDSSRLHRKVGNPLNLHHHENISSYSPIAKKEVDEVLREVSVQRQKKSKDDLELLK
jgi:hypothetical protein